MTFKLTAHGQVNSELIPISLEPVL